MDDISLGKVVWMDVTDPQGNEVGEHAVLILITKKEHLEGKPLKGVVVSTKLNWAQKDRRVEMPYSPGFRHIKTGFSERCAAMCDWIVDIDLSHINSWGGHVGKKWMDEIALKILAKLSTQS